MIIPGFWCIPIPLGQAGCDPDGDPRDTDGGGVTVDLGDNDDLGTVRWVPGTAARPGAIRVSGGDGNDLIENASDGFIQFDGGAGDDALISGPTASAILLGGPGADVMDAGGDCCATASYEDHGGRGVRVTLDGERNDGEDGERDDVRTAAVIGSPGPDTIRGDARANTLTGGEGSDRLDGAGGDDRIEATYRDAAGGKDTVTCGTGNDHVTADESDKVAVDCERIRVEPAIVPDLVLDAGNGRATRSGLLTLTFRLPAGGLATASRSTVRLVDRKGRRASSTAAFALSRGAPVAQVRIRLNRQTRRRLARSRSGVIRLVAQRVSRDAEAGSAATGFEKRHLVVRVRRAKR